ncbi:helix-turn-helix transcriptional regulator [Nocardia sp. NPDC052001]|uniref:helix-turn-helix domain-containing protein n=1 Tax=Nocardia sp. NPDC052001 TaxID=3154853 RepID=UPI0034360834
MVTDVFAHRLNESIGRWEHQHGRRLPNTELVARLAEAGHSMSMAYLSQLRRGRRDRPSMELLVALARVFDVPADHFTNAGKDFDTAPHHVAAGLTNSGLRRLINAAAGLSAESLDYLSLLADRLRRADRLPAESQTAGWVL